MLMIALRDMESMENSILKQLLSLNRAALVKDFLIYASKAPCEYL